MSLLVVDLQTTLQYPAETFIRIIESVFLSLVVLLIWCSVLMLNQADQSLINSITVFYLIIPLISQLTGAWHGYFVAKEIRDGTFSKYLLRPLSFIYYDIVNNLTEKVYKILFILPFVGVGFY